tara:strand:- start:120 stop:683 length:564 start_codon:yes stop_codon:yes gene_type:complete
MARRRKVGQCRICKKKKNLDPHHIISRGHAKKTKQRELITNQGNIVWICRKCHNQTTASKSRWKIMHEGKEMEVLTITVKELQAEISRMKSENNIRMREVRKLADEEISRKNAEINRLEEENEEIRQSQELLDTLSLEYQIAQGTKKIFNQVSKEILKTSKEIEKEIKGAVKSAKKIGKDLRKKTGL